MRSLFSFFVSVVLNLVFLSSCGDPNEQALSPTPDAAALNLFIQSNNAGKVQRFKIDASTGDMLTGQQGTVLQFSENSFNDESGNPITGEVDIQLIEIFTRGDMALTKKATMGLDANGGLSALKSGGQFFVSAQQNGKSLQLTKPYTIIAPVSNTGGADENMSLFTGIEECKANICNVVWQQDDGDRNVGVDQFQTVGGVYSAYYAFRNKFGWTNIDRWYNDPREKTTVYVDVPSGYDAENCAVFMAYKGEPASLAMFDKFDNNTGLFTEHYGLVPIGLEVHFILVSIIENEVHYAIQSATIQKDHTQTFTTVKPISEDGLRTLINGLP